MLKRLMFSTATAALLATSAFAQAPAPPAAPAPTVAPAPAPAVPSAATHSDTKFVTAQASDQWLATKFKGTDVMGTSNEKIGDVTDMLFDKDGKILAYVISVGGFLGIGSKEVAIAPTSFQTIPATDRESAKLKLAMTKDELKAAPDFKTYTAPTTGMGRGPAAPPVAR